MAQNIHELAKKLGATVVARLPETGGGAFGAARLSKLVAELRERLKPGQGARPGRPTCDEWVVHPKVPMSEATQQKLSRLAERVSSSERHVSPMQLAAQLLEDAVHNCPDE